MAKKRNRFKLVPIIGTLILLLLFSLFSVISRDDRLCFTAFNVGQGDAFLFEFPNGQTMLIDSGTRKGGRSVVSALQSKGIRTVDILVLSHPHEDHIGGMTEILRSFTIGKVWDSGFISASKTQQAFLEEIQEKKIRYGHPKAGFKQKIGDAEITVLRPERMLLGTNSDANNNSLVLHVVFGNVSFLLMGDMELEGRRSVGIFPSVTILKAAHHGSWTGIDSALLQQTKPELVILSYGKKNAYGHPHKQTLDLLKSLSIPYLGTSAGTVEIKTDGKTYSVEQLKSTKKNF